MNQYLYLINASCTLFILLMVLRQDKKKIFRVLSVYFLGLFIYQAFWTIILFMWNSISDIDRKLWMVTLFRNNKLWLCSVFPFTLSTLYFINYLLTNED